VGRTEALREQAIAALREAQAIQDSGDTSDEALTRGENALARHQELVGRWHESAASDNRSGRGGFLAGGPSGIRTMDGGTVPFATTRGASARASRPTMFGSASWGDQVLESITSGGQFNAAALAGGSIPVTVPLNPEPVVIGQRTTLLRQLIPGQPAPGGRYAYMRQTVRTNNAAVVVPGAVKPTSVNTLARTDDYTRTVAHLSEPIPRQDLADAPLLVAFVDGEMMYGLSLAVDQQIINGAGTAEMTGILVLSGTQPQAYSTSIIETVRKSITKLEIVDLLADGVVMHPTDWETVELAAMATFAAKDSMPSPVDAMRRSLFGVPVVVTTAMPVGTAVVGDWAHSSEFYTTEEGTIDWSESSVDPDGGGAGIPASDWSRNLVRARAEGRFNVAWTRPTGFVVADLTAA
jgi:HK97 family phage major capsid protein